MGENSKIEWTETTWNPIVGCSKVSPGCANCYAIRNAHRLAGNPNPKVSSVYEGITVRNGKAPANWTGVVRLIKERLNQPYYWQKPRRVFVNSMSDMFHEDLDPVYIGQILNVIGSNPEHTFQVLTKRAENMYRIIDAYYKTLDIEPYPNLWLGVSVENQKMADERIPHLLKVPARVRFLSCEPLLGPIDLQPWFHGMGITISLRPVQVSPKIHWVIVGGESGPNRRPMKLEWARSIKDQCQAVRVPFFGKQWDKVKPLPPDLMIREFPKIVEILR